ncbi:MAG: M24 family metallopeptidase [Candidatus Hodarchaeales archaeon]|jgi:Xaa-Pro aminopeptidase
MKNSLLSYDLELQIVKEKHTQLPAIMQEKQIDCWILFVRETSVNPDPVMGFVVGGDLVWLSAFIFHLRNGILNKTAIVGNFDVDAEKKKNIWDEVIGYKEGINDVLKDYINQINPNKIALNYSEDDVVSDGLSHGMFVKISKILADFNDKFISAKPLIQAVRGRKTRTELDLIKEACLLTEEINTRITKQLKPGMKEIDIQKMFFKEMDREEVIEAWQRVSCPSVDAGPDKVMGHVGPSELTTNKGHTLHNDFGVKIKGYCSDLQRVWFFGTEEEIPNEIMHAFETVKNTIRKAFKVVKPGISGYEVDKIAREYVISQGYEEYAHALGHQVGREAHDGGVILGPLWERYGDTPKGLIEENNVFTLELYVKTKNYGMVSVEEMIQVTKDGCEFIVLPQEKIFIVPS